MRSQVCLAKICIWVVLIEAVYLEKLCGMVCLGSVWILYAMVKENEEWEMFVICRFHTWAVEGGAWVLRVASLFSWTRSQEPSVRSWRTWVVFLFPPPAPWSSAGFPFNWVLFYVLNIWIMLTGGGSEGVYALLDVKLCFNAGFCVGSWMQNNKNSVQLGMTMSVVKCLNVQHWMKKIEFLLM